MKTRWKYINHYAPGIELVELRYAGSKHNRIVQVLTREPLHDMTEGRIENVILEFNRLRERLIKEQEAQDISLTNIQDLWSDSWMLHAEYWVPDESKETLELLERGIEQKRASKLKAKELANQSEERRKIQDLVSKMSFEELKAKLNEK